jgi:integrase
VDGEGVRHREPIGTDRKVAMSVLKAKEGAAVLKIHVGVSEDSRISFADFADEWFESSKGHWGADTAKVYRYILESSLKPAFSGALRSISPTRVEDFMAERLRAGRDKKTINQMVMVLKSIVLNAVDRGVLTKSSLHNSAGRPLVKPYKIPTTEAQWLRPDEVERVLAAVLEGGSCTRHPYHAFFVLAFNTGCRRGELMKLTRKQVNLAERTLTLPQTKNGSFRVVALNDTALDALRSLPGLVGDARSDERLFKFSKGAPTRQFREAAERCGIEGAHLHSTRHTFASLHAMNGAQSRQLAELLGHRDSRMAMRYQHLSDAAYRQQVVDAVQLGGRKAAKLEETSRRAG